MHIQKRFPHNDLDDWRVKKSDTPYFTMYFPAEGKYYCGARGWARSKEHNVNHGAEHTVEHGSAEGQRQGAMHEISSLIFLW